MLANGEEAEYKSVKVCLSSFIVFLIRLLVISINYGEENKLILFYFSLQLSHRKILTSLDAGLDGKIYSWPTSLLANQILAYSSSQFL